MIQKANPEERALKSPKNHFGRDDHYTVTKGGARDLQVENALGKTEKAFGDVMVRIKQRQPLRPKDRVYLSFFAAAMLARVEPFTDNVGGFWRSAQMQARRLEEKHGTCNKLSDEIARVLVNHVGDTVSSFVVENQRMLERMNLTIFTVDDDDGFITSDSPGCLCVPGRLHPFLGHKGVEFTLPLSPHHLAIYAWTKSQLRYELGTRSLVDEVNSRTVSWCAKEFVSWKGTVRREWLEVIPSQ